MAQAIRAAIERRGRTRAGVAKAMGKPPSWLYRITDGKHAIKARDLQALADELDVAVEELYPTSLRAIAESSGQYRSLVSIPVISQATAKSLRGGDVVRHVHIDAAAGFDPDFLVGLEVCDNVLAPDIIEGDVVIVDTARARESGNPVVAQVDGTLHVKRLRIRRSGRWSLVSNAGEISVDPRQVEGVVVGLWRTMGRWADLR